METEAASGIKRLKTQTFSDGTFIDSLLNKVFLLNLNAGVCPERCARNCAGASQYFRSSKVHPGT